MDIVVGNIVKGEDLYGRTSELQQLWEEIEKGSLILTSPRRYGKTSIVHHMKDNPRQGWSVIYIDMEGSADPYEFIIEILNHSESTPLQKIKRFFHSARDSTNNFQILDAIKIELQKPNSDLKKEGTKIFHELIESNSRLIIVIDELPLYLLKMQEKYQDGGSTISTFLHWLRKMRQDLQIRFIVCGSIGIHALVDRYGLENSVNDLAKVSLPPFDDETAKGMIAAVLNKHNIRHTEDIVNEIMNQIGLQVPFFIQLMLKEARDRTNFGKEELTSEIVTESYRKGLLGTEGKGDFEWYFKRLKGEFRGKNYSVALGILELLTKVPGASESELEDIYKRIKRRENRPEFRQILRILESGYYIRQNKGVILFHNKILRDLWIQEGGVR